ncbi:MAG: hypothetical protein LBT66_02995 [Methanobrevibacter sp.]|jgi:archaellum component FlaC|nr:hypothetical protein [Candidatus Methanovirga meridionalis]
MDKEEEILEILNKINERLTKIENNDLNHIEQSLIKINGRFDLIDEKFIGVNNQFKWIKLILGGFAALIAALKIFGG